MWLSDKAVKQLDKSVLAAVRFLLHSRSREGWLLDFELSAGTSDEWVTAYAGTVLAQVPETPPREAATSLWRLLCTRRRSSGGWGYNGPYPADADATSWGLKLAHAVGARHSHTAIEARRFLAGHIKPGGGVATYADDAPIREHLGVSSNVPFRGWCAPHGCVSASVAALPQFYTRIRYYLRETQNANGAWRSYWWSDDEYAVALAAEALDRGGYGDDHRHVEQAVSWALARVGDAGFVVTNSQPGGSPFATAWCLRTLLLADERRSVSGAIERASKWLLETQRSDGSWPPSARLRVPFPNDEDPHAYPLWIDGWGRLGSINLDYRSVFTTATVLGALQKLREGLD